MQPKLINTISEYHNARGLSKPEHPLISVMRFEDIRMLPNEESISMLMNLYSIALKRDFNGKLKYGQQVYDFDEGIMTFMAPGQLLHIELNKEEVLRHSGWMLLIHPDFLWGTVLAKKIRQYEFFDYCIHEALFLSEKEELSMTGIMQNIAQEYRANIDQFSQNVIIAQIELLLSYAERYYYRQFITRKINNHQVLERLEGVFDSYFNDEQLLAKGLPTVSYIANSLNLSQGYLSSLLKVLTGQSTQQHIQNKIIDKAKEKLSGTSLTVSEIAYQLGFGHPQSFSKLFRSKTNMSPLTFRQTFN